MIFLFELLLLLGEQIIQTKEQNVHAQRRQGKNLKNPNRTCGHDAHGKKVKMQQTSSKYLTRGNKHF
jgi:hypothetical protein